MKSKAKHESLSERREIEDDSTTIGPPAATLDMKNNSIHAPTKHNSNCILRVIRLDATIIKSDRK